MVKSGFVGAMVGLALLLGTTVAFGDVVAKISIAQQRMSVYVDGELTYTWPVSTARKGYTTPRGNFRAQWLDPMHYSSIYEDAPMPYSVFFSGGYAIHGTYETRYLGHPASHGCVRLSPANAEQLYSLIEEQGVRATRVIVK